MKANLEALEHDARAVLALSTAMRDNDAELPTRLRESIETMHAEVLRTSHLVTTHAAVLRSGERERTR